MNIAKSALALALIATAFTATPVLAREGMGLHLSERHNLHLETRHERRNGDIIRRKTDQQATDKGFTRESVLTNAKGETATRHVEVVNDQEAGTHTRTMTGTTFDGKTISGQSVTSKTDTGFTREGTFTGPNGQTSSRDMEVSAENNTVTKTVTTTNPKGKTETHTSTHVIQGGK